MSVCLLITTECGDRVDNCDFSISKGYDIGIALYLGDFYSRLMPPFSMLESVTEICFHISYNADGN